MRYFLELSYQGKQYGGWQIQPHDSSVQATLEEALSKITREQIEVVGCGRTDAGVHASQYFAHFDVAQPLPEHLLSRLNKVLPIDIAIHRIIEVAPDAHARFDAYRRAYQYHIVGQKNPFRNEISTFLYNFQALDVEKMQEAARLLLEFDAFAPFCKSNHDAKTMNCTLYRSEWEWNEAQQSATYHIAANRFLRGMVRLIVGMCINIGLEKLSLAEVRYALETQTLLKKSTSVEPQGLFLTEVKYPYL